MLAVEDLQAGLRGEVAVQVADSQVATAYGASDLPVLATPALVGLLEQAAIQAVEDYLEAGEVSVGGFISLQHLAPTPRGNWVWARATLQEIKERKLKFSLEAWDENGEVGRGEHRRLVVHRQQFLQQAGF